MKKSKSGRSGVEAAEGMRDSVGAAGIRCRSAALALVPARGVCARAQRRGDRSRSALGLGMCRSTKVWAARARQTTPGPPNTKGDDSERQRPKP